MKVIKRGYSLKFNTEIIRPKTETLSFHVVSCFVGKGSPLIHSKTKPAFRLKQLFTCYLAINQARLYINFLVLWMAEFFFYVERSLPDFYRRHNGTFDGKRIFTW